MTERTLEPLVTGGAFFEGPRWHDGRLWVSDFWRRHVLAVAPDGTTEVVAEVPGSPSGLGWLPDGTLLVVSMMDNKLLRVEDGTTVEYADLSAFSGGTANDLVVDAMGRAYIGSVDFANWAEQPTTDLVRVDPDGSVTVVSDGMSFPNGPAITPNGKTLIVAESWAERLTAFDIQPDGSLTGRRVWAPLPGSPPDGIALDAEGAIWATDCHGSGVTRVAEGGKVLDYVSSAPDATFSVGLSRGESPQMFMATTFPFGGGDPWTEHKSKMRRVPVDVPGAGYPA